MSRALVINPAAQDDFDAIWRYSVDRWGKARADTYLDAIDDAVRRIVTEPIGNSRCDHIRPGYVRRSAGSHYVFARVDEQRAVIVRVLHKRMNFTRHLANPSDL